MRTTLLITTYNRPDALDRVLGTVASQHQLPDEVIIADDGSGPATADVVADWRPRIGTPLRHLWQPNRGFRAARSRNNAILAASGDYLIVLDGDMLLHPAFVADHIAAAEPGCFVQGVRLRADAALTSRLLDGEPFDWRWWRNGIAPRQHAMRLPWLSRQTSGKAATMDRIKSCNQAYWRRDLVAANGFDEAMVGWGPEDKELAARLYNAGITRKYLRFAALALHLYHPETSNAAESRLMEILHETQRTGRTRCATGLSPRSPE